MCTYMTDGMNNYTPTSNYVRILENSLITKSIKLGFINDMYCSAVILGRKNYNIAKILKIFHTKMPPMKEKNPGNVNEKLANVLFLGSSFKKVIHQHCQVNSRAF